MLGTAIFLFEKSGKMAAPWAAAGYRCFCFDIQHSIRRDRVEGNIHFIWADARTVRRPVRGPLAFVAAFSPCTHVAGSGARDFDRKGGHMLRDTLELFEAGRLIAEWSDAPYCLENPVGVLSNIPHIGKPHYLFDPFEYAGYADDPDAEAYTKKTCLWTGNGFVMPAKKPVDPVLGSKMWRMPPSDERADDRSETPSGFARAVFHANAPHLKRNAA